MLHISDVRCSMRMVAVCKHLSRAVLHMTTLISSNVRNSKDPFSRILSSLCVVS